MRELTIALVGEGAIADMHMRSLSEIAGVSVTTLVPGVPKDGRTFAEKWKIPSVVAFDNALSSAVDAVIVASPSGLHASQTIAAVDAGKHVLVEIPIGLSREECEAVAKTAAQAAKVVMPCHTRRFSPAHRHLKGEISSGRLTLQHLVAQTYFFRRENLNMEGQRRSWTDSLLWHHAAHTIDLFIWLTEDPAPEMQVQAGQVHPELGCVMDMTISARSRAGALLSLVMSFNNQGPFGGFYRYICDRGTYHVFRDELDDAEHRPIPVAGNAFLDQDQAFIAAARGDARQAVTIADILPSMGSIANLAARLGGLG